MIFQRFLGSTNVASLVERKTPYAVLFRNNDRSSKMLMNRLINLLSPLPVTARRSITFDRGLEFVSWWELESGMEHRRGFATLKLPGRRVRSRT